MSNLNQRTQFRTRDHPNSGIMGRNQTQKKPQSGARKLKLAPNKRIAVKNSYSSLRKVCDQFNIPCVKKTLGIGIIRICCRTLEQLDNITLIVKELLKEHLIEEIGMPLEYTYKMKSLVIFLKPADILSSKKIDYVFQQCVIKYHYVKVDAVKESFKKPQKAMKNISSLNHVTKIIFLVTIISILITAVLSVAQN